MTVLAALELWQEEARKADMADTEGHEVADITQNRYKVSGWVMGWIFVYNWVFLKQCYADKQHCLAGYANCASAHEVGVIGGC